MLRRNMLIVISLSMAAAGCAIHPLPEQVTGLNTVQIVNHIRCEARDAVITAMGIYLSRANPDEPTIQEGLKLLDTHDFRQVDLDAMNRDARANIKKYLPSAIAFDFTFDITETNDVGSQIDFLSTFTRGVFGLGLAADNNLQRETTRNFRISDTFDELIGPTDYCNRQTVGPDWSYPIAGTIGLEEIVETFVNLNVFEHLSGKGEKDTVPVLADTLNFQTTLTGSASPKVVIAPIKHNGFQVAGASVTLSATRKDIHKVIVALSLPPGKPATAAANAQIIGPAFRLTNLSFHKTPAEQNAIAEIYNQIERNILFNLVVRPN
jgi:hypothetical protein